MKPNIPNLAKNLAAMILLFATGPAAAEPLSGTWRTQDGSSNVEFYGCGAHRCGRIVWLREPIDAATGEPWRDKLNKVRSLRNRQLLGLDIIFDLAPNGPNRMKGKLYNPLDGKTYTGKLTSEGDRLLMQGCVLGGLFCKNERWTLVKGS